MAWIESHQGLATHPKTGKLARLLKISRPQAVGHLHLLWYFALEYAPTGDLFHIDAEEIAEGSMWGGDADTFLSALIASGFVDDVDGKHSLHEWDKYGGKTVTRMKKDKDRKGKGRESHGSSGEAPGAGAANREEFQRNSSGIPGEPAQASGGVPSANINNNNDNNVLVGVGVPPAHTQYISGGTASGKVDVMEWVRIYRKRFGEREPRRETMVSVEAHWNEYFERDPTADENYAIGLCYMILMASGLHEDLFPEEIKLALEAAANHGADNFASYIIGVFKIRFEGYLPRARAG